MFDIGFSEILVIAVVALIVIGPERLPKVARTLGHLFGRMQRYVNDVKTDISREMELDELRKLQATMRDTARSIEQSVNSEISAAQSELESIAAPAGASAPEPDSAVTVSAAEPASAAGVHAAEPTSAAGGHAAEPGPAAGIHAAKPEPVAQLELGLDASKAGGRNPT